MPPKQTMDTKIEAVDQQETGKVKKKIKKLEEQFDDVKGQLKMATTDSKVANWWKEKMGLGKALDHSQEVLEQLQEGKLVLLKLDTSLVLTVNALSTRLYYPHLPFSSLYAFISMDCLYQFDMCL